MKIIFDDGTEQEFTNATVINVQPGDVIVFQTQDRLSDEAHARAKEIMKEIVGDIRVLILEMGMELTAVLRKEIINGTSQR